MINYFSRYYDGGIYMLYMVLALVLFLLFLGVVVLLNFLVNYLTSFRTDSDFVLQSEDYMFFKGVFIGLVVLAVGILGVLSTVLVMYGA